jgi:multidrug efflux pump subunit AcrA (membrane-fusion protein)
MPAFTVAPVPLDFLVIMQGLAAENVSQENQLLNARSAQLRAHNVFRQPPAHPHSVRNALHVYVVTLQALAAENVSLENQLLEARSAQLRAQKDAAAATSAASKLEERSSQLSASASKANAELAGLQAERRILKARLMQAEARMRNAGLAPLPPMPSGMGAGALRAVVCVSTVCRQHVCHGVCIARVMRVCLVQLAQLAGLEFEARRSAVWGWRHCH